MDGTDHLGAVRDRLVGVELAGLAQALDDDLGVLVDENAHARPPVSCQDLLGAVLHVVCADEVEARLVEDLLAQLHVGSLEPHHERHLETDLAHRLDDAGGDHVAPHDPAEDVDEDALDVRVLR